MAISGAEASIAALRHAVERNTAFGIVVDDEVRMDRCTNLRNIYRGKGLYGPLVERRERKFEQEMARSTSPYESHLSPRDRIDVLRRLEGPPATENPDAAWDLLPEAEILADMMTDWLAARVREMIARKHRVRHHVLRRHGQIR